MNFKYENFLKAHETKDGEVSTHTRIGKPELNVYGKSYHIPASDLPTFRRLYFEHVLSKKNEEYLTERQLEYGPLVVDFDFRYSPEVRERQHNDKHLSDIIALYFESISVIFKIDQEVTVPVYVMHKKDVVCENEVTKDGIHVIFGSGMERNCRQAVRKLVLNDIPYVMDEIPVTNSWNDVLDEGVAKGSCNWQMYGSCKPGKDAYEMTHMWSVTYDPANYEKNGTRWPLTRESEETMRNFIRPENLIMLSVQNNEWPTFPILEEDKVKTFVSSFDKKRKRARSTSTAAADIATDDDLVQYDTLPKTKERKLLEIIKIRKEDYDASEYRSLKFNICSFIIQQNEEMCNTDWIAFLERNGLNMDDENVNLYHKLNPREFMKGNIGFLCNLAKKTNPREYQIFKIEFPYSKKQKTDDGLLAEIRKFVNEILTIDRDFFTNRDNWANLGFVIYNASDGSEEGEDLFDEISQRNKNYEDRQTVKKQYYDTQRKNEELNVDWLSTTLKKLKPDHHLVADVKAPRFAETDDQASDILFHELKDTFKSYRRRLFMLKDNVWIHDAGAIDDHSLNYIMKSMIYSGQDKKNNKLIPYTQNITKAKKVQEALYSKIRTNNEDHKLYEKFHETTKGIVCFKDGILDFKTKTFTLWADIEAGTIFTTTKINRNYAEYFNNPNHQLIEKIKSDLFEPLYGDKTDVALQFLSRALAGHHEDKRWATYLGNRNCGKGVEYDALSCAFDGYVSSFNLDNVLCSSEISSRATVESARMNYWLLDLEFIRLAVSQETPDPNKGLKLNGGIWKKYTGGGDTIVARRNFDKADTHFKIDTTFYIKGNNTLKCKPSDCNETRLQFTSTTQFVTRAEIDKLKEDLRKEIEEEIDEPEKKRQQARQILKKYRVADHDIKNKCKTYEWMNAIVYLVMQAYSNHSVKIEISISNDDDDVETGSASIITTLYEKFEFTNNPENTLSLAELKEMMRYQDLGKVENELKNMNVIKKKVRVRGPHYNKVCFHGIKIKSNANNDLV